VTRCQAVAAQLSAVVEEMLQLDDIELQEAIDDLPEAERDELLELLEGEATMESPSEFLARLVPSEPPPDHTRLLRDFFERARHDQIRECHSMPPRHAKTVTVMRCLAWWIVTHPADMCAYVTYSSTQARKKSRIIRELVERAGMPLMRGSKSLEQWQTVHGGGLHAVGAKGGLTGNGYEGVVVYDDPYKSLIDAASARERDTIQELFSAAVYTRLQGASVLVMHTRWDVNDLIGWLVKDKGWKVINVEAIAPANDNILAEVDPLGRAPGEALWSALFPVKRCTGPCAHHGHLEDIQEQIGPYLWSALYCGKPPRRGGAVFGDPTQYVLADFKLDGHRPGIGVDPAITASTAADYSVLMVGAMIGAGTNAKLYILDVVRRQVELPELVKLAMPLTEQWPGAPMFVEAVAGFKAVPQSIVAADATIRAHEHEKLCAAAVVNGNAAPAMPPPRVRVIPVYPTRDKLLRAQPVAAAYLAGRVLVPKDAPWAAALIAELRAFTGVGDEHDDQVDALAHLWNGLWRSSGGAIIGGILTSDSAPGYAESSAA
jgi:predicted phage terminase large subunit-like protein